MEPFNPPTDKPTRTFLLWFLGICTMMNAGMNVISFSMYAFCPNFIQQSMELVKNMSIFNGNEYQEMFDVFLSIPSWKYIPLILAEVASFAGALIMLWKLNSIGFHIYTIGQILEICTLNFIIGGKMVMPLSAVMMTVLIIIMYATQLRYMKKTSDTENQPDPNEEQPTRYE